MRLSIVGHRGACQFLAGRIIHRAPRQRGLAPGRDLTTRHGQFQRRRRLFPRSIEMMRRTAVAVVAGSRRLQAQPLRGD